MKIAFVNQPYDRVFPPGQNSIGLVVYNTALELADEASLTLYSNRAISGDVPVGLPFTTRPLAVPLDERLHRAVRDHPRWARRFGLQWLSDAHPQYARSVRESLDHDGTDIVHVMNYWNWCRQVRGSGHRKVVLEMHCEWLSQKDSRAVAAQLCAVDAVVGVSDHITGLFRQSFPDYPGLVATVYNGVDIDAFSPQEKPDAEAQRRGPSILFVGRVSPEKGVHTLLEAFARVVAEIPEARLDIIGARASLPPEFIVDISADSLVFALKRFYDGSLASDYQRYLDETVIRLGLEGKVRFLGPKPHQELIAAYQAADLVVNPSLSESFGISIVEGMASGVPVIGARIGGMRETVLNGETGLLVEPEEPEALAHAITAILGDPAIASTMGQKGRAQAVEKFSWRARAKRLLDVYRTVAAWPGIAQ
jgi:glycosyltransferase involved in cell wall biosynthesis